jgi:hypothetical protein
MYGIYANIGGIIMVNVTIYGSTMDPMGNCTSFPITNQRNPSSRRRDLSQQELYSDVHQKEIRKLTNKKNIPSSELT